MKQNTVIHKLKNRWVKLWLQPIRVFVFHQVSDIYEENTMWHCDWTETRLFKENITKLKQQYTFISLKDACSLIQKNKFRFHKYAVLTSDDGWASILNILPWLHEQNIPITLFLNPVYLEGEQIREKGMNKLMSIKQLNDITSSNNNITIASHGWNHDNCDLLDINTFAYNVSRCREYFAQLKGYIPFFAYPYGKHTREQDKYLISQQIIPVYCDGTKNYNKIGIHRECIDGLSL